MNKPRTKACRMAATACGAIALICSAGTALASEKVHLVTESYPPYNYAENGELTGFVVDFVKAIMTDADIDYDMELMPWARAISLAENNDDYCVFTTVHTSERNLRFQWVEPLVTAYNYLIKKKGSPVEASNIEEATKYLVGTQLGDYTVEILNSKGFERLDITSEIDLTLNKLLKGRIDLMPMADGTIREKLDEGVEIKPLLVLVSVVNSIACNIKMPPDIIARMQASLDKLAANGTKAEIFTKYGFVEGALK